MILDKNQQAFFELLKAGLWGGQGPAQEFKSSSVQDSVDWEKIYQLAQEQSVQGVVLSGIEELRAKGIELNVPKVLLLQWIGEVQIIEQRNKEMNAFVAELIEKLRKNDIYAILVKGQGIAQCYEKPLWRVCGDVDLLLSNENYEKAKKVLLPIAIDVEDEYKTFKHIGMTMKGGFVVELHGTLHSRLSNRVDSVIDEAQRSIFFMGNVRSWQNGNTQVFLPDIDEDVIFVFTHILHHYYIEGIGLRQICDWCSLMWTYKESQNYGLLESRIKRAGLMSEWKVFRALAIEYLGMPIVTMPCCEGFSTFEVAKPINNIQEFKKLKLKSDKIMEFVLETGNFGHNRKAAKSKVGSVWNKTKDFANHIRVFPWDSFKFFFHFLKDGLILVFK